MEALATDIVPHHQSLLIMASAATTFGCLARVYDQLPVFTFTFDVAGKPHHDGDQRWPNGAYVISDAHLKPLSLAYHDQLD